MATYCLDADMAEIRPNILNYGQATWEDQRAEADLQINRIVTIRWYRAAAKAHYIDTFLVGNEFDQTKVDATQLKRAAVFKSLELAYQYLMKDAPEPDGFERNAEYFATQFQKEMDLVIAAGLKYDWDDDGSTDDEVSQPVTRRLMRG